MTDLEKELEALVNKASELINKAKEDGNRELTDEETVLVEESLSKADDLRKQVSKSKKTASVIEKFSRLKNDLDSESDKAVKAVVGNSTKEIKIEAKDKMTQEQDNKLAGIRAFARSGNKEALKEFAITSGTNGGALIPTRVMEPQVVRQPRNAIRAGLQALGIGTDVSSSTENVKLPFFDDSANVATKITNGASGTGTEGECNPCREVLPGITSKDVPLVEYHSEPAFYSKRFIYAQDWNVDEKTYPMLESRIERLEEVDWITSIKSGISGQTVTTAGSLTVSGDDMIELDESLGVAYDGLPSFFVISKALRKAVRKLKGSDGQYILGYENGVQTLFGQPVFVSAALDGLTANGIAGLKIAAEGIVVRDTTHNELVRYEGESAHPNQVGFEAFSYSGFNYATLAIGGLKIKP